MNSIGGILVTCFCGIVCWCRWSNPQFDGTLHRHPHWKRCISWRNTGCAVQNQSACELNTQINTFSVVLNLGIPFWGVSKAPKIWKSLLNEGWNFEFDNFDSCSALRSLVTENVSYSNGMRNTYEFCCVLWWVDFFAVWVTNLLYILGILRNSKISECDCQWNSWVWIFGFVLAEDVNSCRGNSQYERKLLKHSQYENYLSLGTELILRQVVDLLAWWVRRFIYLCRVRVCFHTTLQTASSDMILCNANFQKT